MCTDCLRCVAFVRVHTGSFHPFGEHSILLILLASVLAASSLVASLRPIRNERFVTARIAHRSDDFVEIITLFALLLRRFGQVNDRASHTFFVISNSYFSARIYNTLLILNIDMLFVPFQCSILRSSELMLLLSSGNPFCRKIICFRCNQLSLGPSPKNHDHTDIVKRNHCLEKPPPSPSKVASISISQIAFCRYATAD